MDLPHADPRERRAGKQEDRKAGKALPDLGISGEGRISFDVRRTYQPSVRFLFSFLPAFLFIVLPDYGSIAVFLRAVFRAGLLR